MDRTVVRSALLGAVFALAMILLFSGGDVDRMTISDGLIERRVAANLDAAPSEVLPQVVERGTALRYGRIGLPLALWLFSAGQNDAMPYVQPILMVAAAAAACGAAAMLLGGRSP